MIKQKKNNFIKVGSRSSPLAQLQVDEVYFLLNQKYPEIEFDPVTFQTQGDKDKKTSLTADCGDDFFTDALDEAVLKGDIDVAVHSAKDLPKKLRSGLSIFALTAALDDTDAFVGNVHFADLKPGAKIGSSSLTRQEAVRKLNPKLEILDIRGTIDERIGLIEQGVCDGIIVATVALKRLNLEHRIKDIMPWEAVPLQGQLAVVGRRDDVYLKNLFAAIDVRCTYGRVSLVGAGPGDPDLITVKGIKLLNEADCVFYDFLAHKDLLNYAPKAEKISVGKRKGQHTLAQAELSRLIRQKAVQGKKVVRLKGGDPLIFGRGAEEIEYLRAYHIEVNVVPGVSSATSIPSSLGVPLTARNVSSSVAFVSGHEQGENSHDPQLVRIPNVDTLVFLMGLTKLDIIVQSLYKAGWPKETPLMIISRGTCPDERIVCGQLQTIVAEAAKHPLKQPALIIAGQTVNFWHAAHYQKGKILYTGTQPDQFKLIGDIIHLPMIQITQADMDPQDVKGLLGRLRHYHMIVLTSRYAVQYFFQLLADNGYENSNLRDKDFLVIGKSTAEALGRYPFAPALVSLEETSEGLLRAITQKFNVRHKKMLFPRSSIPNPFLKTELEKLGACVDEVVVYQNKKLPKRELPTEGIDKIIFTSPSTVRNFLRDYEQIPRSWKILSKGPVTRKSLLDAGYESEVLICD